MTKADIINEIALSTGLQKKDVAVVVESLMGTIKDSLLNKKENTARNILKNTTMTIDAHDFPSFKPAKSFAEKMKQG